MRPPYDAIVAGARCAGSPVAMLLARGGYRVLVVDRATFPSDTLSTHVVHPPGVAALARWGLLDRVRAHRPGHLRRLPGRRAVRRGARRGALRHPGDRRGLGRLPRRTRPARPAHVRAHGAARAPGTPGPRGRPARRRNARQPGGDGRLRPDETAGADGR